MHCDRHDFVRSLTTNVVRNSQVVEVLCTNQVGGDHWTSQTKQRLRMRITQAECQATFPPIVMMSDHSGKMSEYRQARQVLAQADGNSYPHGVMSYEEYCSIPNKDRNPVCSACTYLVRYPSPRRYRREQHCDRIGSENPRRPRLHGKSQDLSAPRAPSSHQSVCDTKDSRSAWWEKDPL